MKWLFVNAFLLAMGFSESVHGKSGTTIELCFKCCRCDSQLRNMLDEKPKIHHQSLTIFPNSRVDIDTLITRRTMAACAEENADCVEQNRLVCRAKLVSDSPECFTPRGTSSNSTPSDSSRTASTTSTSTTECSCSTRTCK